MPNVPLGDSVKAVLEGGPAEIPSDLRTRTRLPVDGKIKVPHQGGYEHFELIDADKAGGQGDADGHGAGMGPAVFRWTMRTKIAE